MNTNQTKNCSLESRVTELIAYAATELEAANIKGRDLRVELVRLRKLTGVHFHADVMRREYADNAERIDLLKQIIDRLSA